MLLFELLLSKKPIPLKDMSDVLEMSAIPSLESSYLSAAVIDDKDWAALARLLL